MGSVGDATYESWWGDSCWAKYKGLRLLHVIENLELNS